MNRINKAIELLRERQPAYYVSTNDFSVENGRRMAMTPADIIRLDLEHGPFDMKGVHDFMVGLVEGGPTKSGHRTPTVVSELPFDGVDETVVRANHWIIKHLLACGVHGVILCHAESAAAVRSVAEAMCYAFTRSVATPSAVSGRRGYGGQKTAAEIWGLDPEEYLDKADLWPQNPNGELILGIKLENIRAVDNGHETLAAPGLAFAEWGPGDLGMSLGYRDCHTPPHPEDMIRVREKVLRMCKDREVLFLDAAYSQDELLKVIDDGTMIIRMPPEDVDGCLPDHGRKYTGRTLRW